MKQNIHTVKKILLTLALLVVIGNGITLLLVIPPDQFTFGIFLTNTIYSILFGGILAAGISWILFWLEKRHPWLKNPLKRLVLQLTLTIGYSLLIVGIMILIMALWLEGGLPPELLYESSLFMIQVVIFFLLLSMLVTHVFLFFKNWKKSVIMQEQLKREQLALKYETLKNQVNPHFLFNSLNSVSSLIKTDPEKAELFVKKLSEVFRYVLEQKDNEIATVDAELNFLESYVYLQKIRFGENLVVNIDVKERNHFIMPLSLQMLIENAIKHNVISKEFPLTISVYSKDGYIVVTNNLRKKQALNSGNTGLENIRSRYGFFTSDPVIISQKDGNFTVEIPLIDSGAGLDAERPGTSNPASRPVPPDHLSQQKEISPD
jgi:hypothetical protein